MERLNEFLYQLISARAGGSIFFDDTAVFLADFLLYFMILGAVVFLIRQPHWKKRWFILMEAGIAAILSRGILTEILHRFYEHPRPFAFYGAEPLVESLGNSFPSGHMAFIFALATTLFLHNRRWGTWYFVLGALMGVSRIFAGVHWPLDILGGMFVGILSALMIHRLLKSTWTAPAPELGTHPELH